MYGFDYCLSFPSCSIGWFGLKSLPLISLSPAGLVGGRAMRLWHMNNETEYELFITDASHIIVWPKLKIAFKWSNLLSHWQGWTLSFSGCLKKDSPEQSLNFFYFIFFNFTPPSTKSFTRELFHTLTFYRLFFQFDTTNPLQQLSYII